MNDLREAIDSDLKLSGVPKLHRGAIVEYIMQHRTKAEQQLLTELLGTLSEQKDDISNHDRETSSITPKQVTAFNQGIERAVEAIEKYREGL